jgi:hypothetical protein
MTGKLETVAKAALELPEREQVDLLLLLLERMTPTRPEAELLTDELKAELDQRARFCEEHPELLIPAEEAHQRISQLLKSRRAS